jgi:ribonuclease E
MTTRMLIDARHREETRVAVVKGNRIEEFDFESAEHKQIKGNIYLAKVTRVEPSLQAAFVDYGGNRHGFLAFAEIHPDYYQIPREDREALLREEAEHAAEEAAILAEEEAAYDDDYDDSDGHEDAAEAADDHDDMDGDAEHAATDDGEDTDDEDAADEDGGDGRESGRRSGGRKGLIDPSRSNELRRKRMALRRRYKIQDVIKRRQVLLVQVVKEERGNKGAALTTYLSLAGRYCVLMPNTSHGGGISRKISSGADRKRLKTIIAEMNLPATMGCIVRTAGLERTKTEIKRDFDYLARLWDEIREKTLSATAPADIHSDSDLVKRAIRDIYNRDIEDVLVEGEDGYRAAREFMKLLMPSHAKKVRHYADPVSLFQRYGVEDQLAAMYSPTVQLKSGGYLVINPTEALVSIDINSGRSTKEHGIEATALKTNMEAAHEIARQLRLRDMAGLVVIDFIDMEHNSNIRKIERAMKDALKHDRARIQVGRISQFGLLEMSRQRLRTGVLEASTKVCPHCEGTGLVRTASSAALSVLRLLEETAASGRGSRLLLRASQEATIYALNNKRAQIAEIEDRYHVTISILPDGETEGARMAIDVSGPPPADVPRYEPVIDLDDAEDDIIDDYEDEEEEEERRPARQGRDGGRDRGRDDSRGDGEGRRGRNRRRRRGGKRRDEGYEPSDREASDRETSGDSDAAAEDEGDMDRAAHGGEPNGDIEGGRSRRNRRRGGRNRNRRSREDGGQEAMGRDDAAQVEAAEAPIAAAPTDAATEAAPKPRGRKRKADASVAAAAPDAAPETAAAPAKKPARGRKAAAAEPVAAAPDAVVEKPKRTRKTAAKAEAAQAEPDAAEAVPAKKPAARKTKAAKADAQAAADAAPEEKSAPKKGGWWQRTFGATAE